MDSQGRTPGAAMDSQERNQVQTDASREETALNLTQSSAVPGGTKPENHFSTETVQVQSAVLLSEDDADSTSSESSQAQVAERSPEGADSSQEKQEAATRGGINLVQEEGSEGGIFFHLEECDENEVLLQMGDCDAGQALLQVGEFDGDITVLQMEGYDAGDILFQVEQVDGGDALFHVEECQGSSLVGESDHVGENASLQTGIRQGDQNLLQTEQCDVNTLLEVDNCNGDAMFQVEECHVHGSLLQLVEGEVDEGVHVENCGEGDASLQAMDSEGSTCMQVERAETDDAMLQTMECEDRALLRVEDGDQGNPLSQVVEENVSAESQTDAWRLHVDQEAGSLDVPMEEPGAPTEQGQQSTVQESMTNNLGNTLKPYDQPENSTSEASSPMEYTEEKKEAFEDSVEPGDRVTGSLLLSQEKALEGDGPQSRGESDVEKEADEAGARGKQVGDVGSLLERLKLNEAQMELALEAHRVQVDQLTKQLDFVQEELQFSQRETAETRSASAVTLQHLNALCKQQAEVNNHQKQTEISLRSELDFLRVQLNYEVDRVRELQVYAINLKTDNQLKEQTLFQQFSVIENLRSLLNQREHASQRDSALLKEKEALVCELQGRLDSLTKEVEDLKAAMVLKNACQVGDNMLIHGLQQQVTAAVGEKLQLAGRLEKLLEERQSQTEKMEALEQELAEAKSCKGQRSKKGVAGRKRSLSSLQRSTQSCQDADQSPEPQPHGDQATGDQGEGSRLPSATPQGVTTRSRGMDLKAAPSEVANPARAGDATTGEKTSRGTTSLVRSLLSDPHCEVAKKMKHGGTA